MASKNKKSYKKNKKNSKNKNNDPNTPPNSSIVSRNKNKCPRDQCECWIRLKKYCEFFKLDYSTIDENMEIDEIAEKITNQRRTSSKMLEMDMTTLWQHYLFYHLGVENYAQCHLHSLCLFVKGQALNPDYYYRKQSWNLMQTMHVYFFHTNEYMQSRNSSARKHRYMRQKSSYRIRQTHPTHADSPIRRTTTRKRYSFGAMDNININQSITNKEVETQTQTLTLEIGPGFSHKNSDSTNSNKIDSNSMNNSDNYDDDDDDNDDDDDDLDVNVNQITELIPNDYYAIQYQSTASKVPLRVLEFGLPFAIKIEDAKYKNPKQEILNNTYCKIEKKEWNELLKSCIAYSKKQNAKKIGLKLKQVVGLKLYTDFDELQREYRKCYRENQPDRKVRQKQFYHWNYVLLVAVSKSQDIITNTLYHGVNEAFQTPSYSGTYWGPISTTTIFEIAKQFAGNKGRIFELYPTFGRRGLKVDWISNFPDEGEILYMNTSFQIVNVYKSDAHIVNNLYTNYYNSQTNGDNNNDNTSYFEKSILKALHVINTESNVISFSDMQDLSKGQDLYFHHLDEHEQISILYLLYLQYTKDWNKFWKNKNKYKRIAFAKYRDQFIVLAKNVKAVKMERCPMLLQHFFYESHKKYKFPFKCGDISQGIGTTKINFIKNQPIRFETITRLFPNTQQLLINGNNFDWTLERLIKFMMKYDLYGVSLQEIQIRFIPQYPTFDEKFEADEQEAAQRLQKAKAHKNITKLRKLGWIFETSCHLRRIGFEPLPELPFLLVFIPGDNELFYKTYSRKILNRPVLNATSRIRGMTDSVYGYGYSTDLSYTLDGHGGYGNRQSYSYSAYTGYRKSVAVTPGVPGVIASPMPPLNEGIQYAARSYEFPSMNQNQNLNLKTTQSSSLYTDDNISNRIIPSVITVSDNNNSEEEKYPPPNPIKTHVSLSITPIKSPSSTRSFSNLLGPPKQNSYEGQNPLVLGYNPKNCVLSRDVLDKLEYKKKLIEMLFWRLKNANIRKPNDIIKKKFIKYCRLVQVLVIDPLTPELETLFTVIPNKKPIISLENVFKLFPDVTDIFLRNTQLNLRIAYRIQNFVKSYPHNKIERIFFSKNPPIGKAQIPQLQEILRLVSFGFMESEQMLINNSN